MWKAPHASTGCLHQGTRASSLAGLSSYVGFHADSAVPAGKCAAGPITCLSHEGSLRYRRSRCSIQLRLPRRDARSIVNCVRTSMLINKRRFSKNTFIDFFGG
jgi:hypothetical protein